MDSIFSNSDYFNSEHKSNEVREIMEIDRMLSMAHWVIKCAIDEPNCDMLCSSLLDRLGEPVFYKMVIFETLKNIRIFLYANKREEDFPHRVQLQNLGYWLGMITLGRNKPILHIDLDIKALLVEAYNKGPHELFYVVPFVARIFAHCAYSRIFCPPNPWTMSIINILAEVCMDPDLKVNLQFEIEVLCQNLRIDITHLKQTRYLKSPVQRYTLEHQLSYICQIQINNGEQQQYYWNESILKQVVDITSERQTTQPPQQSVEKVQPQFHYLDIDTTGIAQNASHVTVRDAIPLFQIFPHLVSSVGPSIERAISECFEEVLTNSMSIALKSSEYYTRKDITLDPQEMRMRMTARYMICSFAAGLSLMNCRKKILVSIKKQLFEAFCDGITLTSQQIYFAKEAADIVTADNMRLACVFIQKKVIEAAIPEMDKFSLTDNMGPRQIVHQEGRDYDCNTSAAYQAEYMPDRPRLQTYGAIAQMLVYEEFSNNIPGLSPLHEHEIQTISSSNSDHHLPTYNGCVDSNLESAFQQLQVRDVVNPPHVTERSKYLLHEWIYLYHSVEYLRDPEKTSDAFIHRMVMTGILWKDEAMTQFFKTTIRLCMDGCNRELAQKYAARSAGNIKCFRILDAFVRLVVSLMKKVGGPHYNVFKVNLLDRVLHIIAEVLLQDHGTRGRNFHQLPYHRILILLFLELYTFQSVSDQYSSEIISGFCRVLHILRPSKASKFSCAWLDIIGHRAFLERVMNFEWPFDCLNIYARIWADLSEVLAAHFQNAMYKKFFITFYKRTLQILLVLLHDFPLFLCYYADHLCDNLPLNCIQLRNVILSAYPNDLHETDPFFPALEVNMLNGILSAPPSAHNRTALKMPRQLAIKLNNYLETAEPRTFLDELQRELRVPHGHGMRYDVILINTMVRLVGMEGVKFIQSNRNHLDMSTFPHSTHRDVFQYLARNLDNEGRIILFNAIVNHLRYPNTLTYYYICTLLYLFSTAETQMIQEQITGILVERLIPKGPHPWGLQKTFIELIDNQFYKFWTLDFVQGVPETAATIRSIEKWCRV